MSMRFSGSKRNAAKRSCLLLGSLASFLLVIGGFGLFRQLPTSYHASTAPGLMIDLPDDSTGTANHSLHSGAQKRLTAHLNEAEGTLARKFLHVIPPSDNERQLLVHADNTAQDHVDYIYDGFDRRHPPHH
ncbi:hypothetical protein O6H91_20G025600 [Diphasiastrum complanatum]|uniref:Uncharacterized protein n=1 Tax=Diphasiastrum complanatum TaxID=34168 RepID=A0ACC2ANN5_DIPCM|nr:hypothetical protein O6H91_20G025600 [Diphasiastrum complanatum]